MSKINDLIYELVGTGYSIEEACENIDMNSEELTLEELMELDTCIFKCDNCDQWYNNGDMVESSDDSSKICRNCDEYR